MKNIILFVIVVLLAGCNPCKYVSKHPECFPADTVRIIDKVITTEKEYIIKDSIHYDTIPCDEETNTAIAPTIYVTKWKVKTDSVFTSKEVAKINPVNVQLQKEKDKLAGKVESLKKWLKIVSITLISLLIALAIIIYIRMKFK